MKKYIFAIILTFCLLFCSCGESFPYTHSDDVPIICNISGTRDIRYSDGALFFSDNGEKRYDIRTGDISVISETAESDAEDTPYPEAWSVGDISYYYESVYDEEREEYQKVLVRCDTKSENIEKYDSEMLTLSRPVFVLDERIYFTDSKSIFSLDNKLEDKKTVAEGIFAYDVISDGEYIYYGVQTEVNLQEIYRMTLDGKDAVSIGIFCRPGELFMSENYLYYKSHEEIPLGGDIALEGKHIYRARHDGSEKQTVYTFDGETENCRTRSECYVGNYIYALYEYVSEDGHYLSFDEGRYELLRIDMTTGETMIINKEETEADTTDE